MRADPCASSPRQVRVGLGRSGRGLGVSVVSGEPERAVGCTSSRSWSRAFCGIATASSLDPDPVPRSSSIQGPSSIGALIPPGARYDPKTARNAGSESRAGPLDRQVSLVFRAAVSLWPVDVPTKPAMRQAPDFAPMCTIGPAAVDKPVNIGGRIKLRLRISLLRFPQQDGEKRLCPVTNTGSTATTSPAGGSVVADVRL